MLHIFSAVVVAEWLRRQTRNLLGSARAGSNPADYAFFFFFSSSHIHCLLFFSSTRSPKFVPPHPASFFHHQMSFLFPSPFLPLTCSSLVQGRDLASAVLALLRGTQTTSASPLSRGLRVGTSAKQSKCMCVASAWHYTYVIYCICMYLAALPPVAFDGISSASCRAVCL